MRKLFAALGLAAIAAVGLTTATAQDAKTDAKKDAKKDAKLDAKQDAEPAIIVPYVPTHHKVVEAMLKTAEVKAGDTVYDLGCGDGRIVIAAVKDFKAKRALGIDFNPERLKDCDKSVVDAKLTPEQTKALTFKKGDVLKLKAGDFKDVDVVTMYLLPSVNRELLPTLKAGLKKGARVVSHDFDFRDLNNVVLWEPEKTVQVESDVRTHAVYLWTVK
ncbi:MAG TPA: class I SAM-dependent methyltransferase [Urbifossiella sp.]|nr:class I SAM-dependent methyltransferase [Urbifossiella sp.]